jgi:two-component system, NtrC family, response regulator GlrR
MREIFAILERAARSNATVLIEGEIGTGKSLAARSVHRASARASGPYVVVDCAALSLELAESELFGNERAAAPVADGAGAFQRADGGTIFLDELAALPLDLQPKLLRFLETSTVRPVGANAPKQLDVRVIAATPRELGAEVRRGNFRADLLHRLEVVKILLPPLRERLEDIPALVERLAHGRLAPGEPAAGENLARLTAYSWPGNVGELGNVLERAFARSGKQGELRFSELLLTFDSGDPERAARMPFPGVTATLPFKQEKARILRDFENAYLQALLARHQGNLSRAAAAAGISRKHLYALLRRCGG